MRSTSQIVAYWGLVVACVVSPAPAAPDYWDPRCLQKIYSGGQRKRDTFSYIRTKTGLPGRQWDIRRSVRTLSAPEVRGRPPFCTTRVTLSKYSAQTGVNSNE